MRRHFSPRVWTGLVTSLALVAAGVAAVACGSDGSNGGDGSGGGGGGGGDDASLFDDLGTGGGGDGSGGGGGGNCNAPIDMYVMQDRSGSMGSDCNIGGTANSKWCHAINALSGYFNSPSASQNAAALQFFPTADHTEALCATGAEYDTPAAPTGQPYATLPTNAFDSLLNATTIDKGAGTPTEAAIRGLTKFTAANRRGGRVTIGILVTDGDPNGCNEDLTFLSGLLQAHFDATHVWTFVIGMQGATFGNLEQIAKGGNAPLHGDQVGTLTDACGQGSGPCRSWNVGDGNPTAFVAALQAIQQQANGCGDAGAYVNPIK